MSLILGTSVDSAPQSSYWIDTNGVRHDFSLADTPVNNFSVTGAAASTYLTIAGTQVLKNKIKKLVFGADYQSVSMVGNNFCRQLAATTSIRIPENLKTSGTYFLAGCTSLVELWCGRFDASASGISASGALNNVPNTTALTRHHKTKVLADAFVTKFTGTSNWKVVTDMANSMTPWLGNKKISEAYLGDVLVYGGSADTGTLFQTAVASSGYICTTTDGWAKFRERRNVGVQPWRGIAIAASNPLVQTAVTNGSYIYTTTDGWKTFTERTNVGSRTWYSVAISPSNPLMQTAVVYGGYIYTTADGWKTFIERTNVGNLNWHAVAMAASNPQIQTAVVYEGNIYTTTNGWASFTVRSSVKSEGGWRSVAISASNPQIQTAVSSFGYIYTTTNGWASCVKRSNAGNRMWNSIAISPTNPLIQTAVPFGDYLYTTTDGWVTCTERTKLSYRDWYGVVISASNPLVQSAMVYGSYIGPGYIYTTADGWNTYTAHTAVGSRTWRAIAIGY